METVKFAARRATKTLPTGRQVQVSLAEDGSFWGIRIGVPGDDIAFALSGEAMDALLELVAAHKVRGVRKWEVQFVVEKA